ncbi:TniQ family protein [Streptomyces sp. NPDC006356]
MEARPVAEPPSLSSLRSLPRSLDPLEDESLPGYVLRLSHWLGVGPGPLILRMGIPNSRKDRTTLIRIPISCAISLGEADLDAFCHATRLSRQETAGLLLASLGTRYGPLSSEFHGRSSSGTRRLQYNNPWLLTTRTQYCPDCLVGDGSEIQQRHGGAWRRLWRLPPVFSCPHHERFLRRYCHLCGELAQNRHSNDLIARPRDSELHPVLCRATPKPGNPRAVSPACGADLTQAPRSEEPMRRDHQSRDVLFTLQKKYLSFLSPDGPEQVSSIGWLTPTAQYFQDLRGVVALIFMTWPEARPHAATPELARIIDTEAERRHELFHRRGAQPRKNRGQPHTPTRRTIPSPPAPSWKSQTASYAHRTKKPQHSSSSPSRTKPSASTSRSVTPSAAPAAPRFPSESSSPTAPRESREAGATLSKPSRQEPRPGRHHELLVTSP